MGPGTARARPSPRYRPESTKVLTRQRLRSSLVLSRQQPVTWQPSKDGERLIGRILLNKRMKDGTVPADTGALLGLKVAPPSGAWQRGTAGFLTVALLQVVGGKMTESGRLCAFITKVKRGSLADTVGHLRPGASPACRQGDAGTSEISLILL